MKASIKLKFITPRGKEVLIIRNFQLAIKNNKYEFKRFEQLLKSHNSAGELVTINSTCIDIDKQVPLLMHSSKAILENVIFCHQEETNWPFSDAGNLKKVFDEIFDTAKYTKAMEDLKDISKSYNTLAKEVKQKLELIQKDVDQYKKVNLGIDATKNKIIEIEETTNELRKLIENTEKDHNQICDYEKSYQNKEYSIRLMEMQLQEKKKQMLTIINDAYFIDYTKDEETYNKFIEKAQEQKNNNLEMENLRIKNEILNSKNDLVVLNKEINNLSAKIMKDSQNFESLNLSKERMIKIIENLEIKFDSEPDFMQMISLIIEKEQEVLSKISLLDDRKKTFEVKMSEKIKDIEVNKQLLDNKNREIEQVKSKKSILLVNLQDFQNKDENLKQVNLELNQITNQINSVKQIEIPAIEEKISNHENLKANINNELKVNYVEHFKLNETTLLNLGKISESLQKFEIVCEQIFSYIKNYNIAFNVTCYTLEDVKQHVINTKEDMTEERAKMREENFLNSHEIIEIEKEIENCKVNLEEKIEDKNFKLKDLKNLFEKLNLSSENNASSFISEEDLKKLQIFKKELEHFVNLKRNEKNFKISEIKVLEDLHSKCILNKQCSLCFSSLMVEANFNDLNAKSPSLPEKFNLKILDLKKSIEDLNIVISQKAILLEEIENTKFNEITSEIESIQNLNSQIALKEKDLNLKLQKRKNYENSSKDKSLMIAKLDLIANEHLMKFKNEHFEIFSNFSLNCESVNLNFKEFDLLDEFNLLKQYDLLKHNQNSKNLENFKNFIIKNQKLISKNLINETEIQILTKKIFDFQKEKSKFLETLNDLYLEEKILEERKFKINEFSASSDIDSKIFDLEKEILFKENEKLNLENESDKISQIQSSLEEKLKEFEKIYFEKYHKYKSINERLQSSKIKIECILSDHNIQNASDYLKQIEDLNSEKAKFENLKLNKEGDLERLQESLTLLESENREHTIYDNLLKSNVELFKLKTEINFLNSEMQKPENKLVTAIDRIQEAKSNIKDKLEECKKQYNINLGKLSELNNYLLKLNNELKLDNFYDIEKRHNKLKMEYILAIETAKNVDK